MSAILTFDNVSTVSHAGDRDVRVEGVSFSLEPGEMVLVHADHESEEVPFLDLATGLVVPDCGQISFAGQDWCAMHDAAQLKARSRIGTLAKEQVWLANQTVLRNVLLAQRHHTSRAEQELEAEADALAQAVGLEEVPRSRPEAVAPRSLRMAGWVRAFIGNPALLVLMFPEQEAMSSWPGILNDLLQSALSGGAAAVVVSDQAELWELPVMRAARHFGMEKGGWAKLL